MFCILGGVGLYEPMFLIILGINLIFSETLIDYIFNLEKGENFFFVIIQTEEEERFVAQR